MKSRAIIAGVLVLIVVLLAWNMLFFSPAGKDRDEAAEARDAAQSQQASLQSTLDRLLDLESRQPEFIEEQARLAGKIPAQPDLQVFIRAAYDLQVESGLDWISIAPTEPAPGPSGVSEIRMTVQLEGGYYQVLDYLNRLEDMSRLVVVDSIQVGAGATDGGEGSTDSTVPTSSGAPTLAVSLSARMFTQATDLSTPITLAPPDTGTETTATTAGATATSAGQAN
jgi:Tfp pilus assembly protein PilO